MLKISINNLDLGGIDFSGDSTPEKFNLQNLDNDEIEFTEPIIYNLHISQVSGGVLVAGSLKTDLSTTCGRCLEDFKMPIEIPDVCHFYEDAGNLNEIDIAPELREDLLLSLPMKYICSEDCPGISIDTLLQKKSEEFDEKLQDENNPWKELDALSDL
jgi:uncharacterized protein